MLLKKYKEFSNLSIIYTCNCDLFDARKYAVVIWHKIVAWQKKPLIERKKGLEYVSHDKEEW